MDAMDEEEMSSISGQIPKEMFGKGPLEVRVAGKAAGFSRKPCNQDVDHDRRRLCFLQEGVYVPSFTPAKGMHTQRVNMPASGNVGKVSGVQLGGCVVSVVADSSGKLQVVELIPLHMTTEIEQVSGRLGTMVVSPGTDKMYQMHSVVHVTAIGPAETTIPMFKKADVQGGRGKKAPVSSKQTTVMVGDDAISAFVGKHLTSTVIKVADIDSLFEVGADNKSLERVQKGVLDLTKVLSCHGMEISLLLARGKIPNKTKCVEFKLLAKHLHVNKGEPLYLLGTKPQIGNPPHLLTAGLFGLDKGAQDISDLPWGQHGDLVVPMLEPIILFATNLNKLLTSSNWQSQVIQLFSPGKCQDVAKALHKLYKSKQIPQFSYLLSCVKTRMFVQEGVPIPSGLLLDLDPKADRIIGNSDPNSDYSEGSDDSDGEEELQGHEQSDDDTSSPAAQMFGTAFGLKHGKSSTKTKRSPRSTSSASPTKRARSTSSSSASHSATHERLVQEGDIEDLSDPVEASENEGEGEDNVSTVV